MPVDPAFLRHLDDAVRTGLEASRDYWSRWVEGSTAAVVIGCAMEGPEVLHEFFPKLFKDKYVRTVKLIATVGLGFVILGVAGELVFTHYADLYEGQLQTFNATLLTDAQTQIAVTERATVEARQATSVVQRDTQALKTDADTQRAIAGMANLRAAEANERAAKLEVEAASLRRGLALVKDRTLVFEDHNVLMAFWNALAPLAPQKAEVRYVAKPGLAKPFDKEVFQVAYEIETAMSAGNWKVNFPLTVSLPDEAHGVYLLLSTQASTQTQAAAKLLQKALSDLPLEVSVMSPAPPEEFSRTAKYGPQAPTYGDISKLMQADQDTILVFVAPRISSNQFRPGEGP